MRRMRERIAIIAATVCVVTSSLAMTTKAGGSLPPTGEAAKGANQPFQHGYDLLILKIGIQKRIHMQRC